MNLNFTVPGTPIAKGRPRFSTYRGKVRTYTPDATVSAENFIRMCARTEMRGKIEQIAGPISMGVTFLFEPPAGWSKSKRERAIIGAAPHVARPDIDNLVKLVKDALNGLAYHDDAQICRINASKSYAEKAETIIHIEEIE